MSDDRTVLNQRIVPYTREQIFKAWTDPELLAEWWGPKGFTNTFHTFELKPQGKWHFTMHGPDGVDYPNTTTYLQVERHALVVYDHGASEGRPPLFRVTVRYGFMQDPDVPWALRECHKKGLDFTPDRTSYFLGRETLVASITPEMGPLQEKLFIALNAGAISATHYFNLPADRVVELGTQIEI